MMVSKGHEEIPAVVISTAEYKKLVSDSATLQVIKNYLENEQYVSSGTLQNILNIKKEGGGQDGVL